MFKDVGLTVTALMMNYSVARASILAVAAAMSASVAYRQGVLRDEEPRPLFFGGVILDVGLVMDRVGHGGLHWVLRGLGVLDFPLSLAMDVGLLPFDTAVWFLWQAEADDVSAPSRNTVPSPRRN
ncbi:MAG: hypothetical protein ACI9S9_001459 [Planctomycetota bacterium]